MDRRFHQTPASLDDMLKRIRSGELRFKQAGVQTRREEKKRERKERHEKLMQEQQQRKQERLLKWERNRERLLRADIWKHRAQQDSERCNDLRILGQLKDLFASDDDGEYCIFEGVPNTIVRVRETRIDGHICYPLYWCEIEDLEDLEDEEGYLVFPDDDDSRWKRGTTALVTFLARRARS